MSDDSVDRVFEKAISTIQTLSYQKGYNSLPRPPANVRIQLYALFKQSTDGDVKELLEKPQGNPTSPEYNLALRKWEAWKSKEGLSITEAKRAYIELLIHTMKTYAMGTIVARELLSELEFMWWQITGSNSFDGNDGGDYQDETNSVLFITNDIDKNSEKLRREVYQTLSNLQKTSKQYCGIRNSTSPLGNPEYHNSFWMKCKRLLSLIASFLVKSMGFIGKTVVNQSLVTLAIIILLKYLQGSIDFTLTKYSAGSVTTFSSLRSWVQEALILASKITGISKVHLQVQ